jgi:hypothetical protein
LQAFFLSFPFEAADLTQSCAEIPGPQQDPISLGLVFYCTMLAGISASPCSQRKARLCSHEVHHAALSERTAVCHQKSIFNQNSTSETFSGTLVWQQMTIMIARGEYLLEIHSWTRVITPEWRCRVRRLGQLEAPIKSFPDLAVARPGPSLPKQLKFSTFTGNQSNSIRMGYEIRINDKRFRVNRGSHIHRAARHSYVLI